MKHFDTKTPQEEKTPNILNVGQQRSAIPTFVDNNSRAVFITLLIDLKNLQRSWYAKYMLVFEVAILKPSTFKSML